MEVLSTIETKVILQLLAEKAAGAKTIKEVYAAIAKAANVEGVQLPSYEEYKKEIEELQKDE